jgi:hypothetical protein
MAENIGPLAVIFLRLHSLIIQARVAAAANSP